jgi:leader peptidase (prepilin peptidase) / N-methyltransferase
LILPEIHALSTFGFASRRRCRHLAARARAIFCARAGSRAHSHVLWLGLAGLAFLIARRDEAGWYLIASLALFAGLAVTILFDVEYFVIPDGPLLFLFATGIATAVFEARGELPARLAAASVAWAVLRLLAWGYEQWRGFPGLGLGDPKLFALAGLWLGFSALPGCLLAAAFSGLVSSAILMREQGLRDGRQPIPFGPHLALGLWLAWAFGPLQMG